MTTTTTTLSTTTAPAFVFIPFVPHQDVSGIETPDLALRPNSSSPTNDFQAPLIQSADGSLGLDVSNNQEAMSTSTPEELEDVDPIQQAVAVTLTGTIGLPTIPMSPDEP